jgi:hypothetical protein
MDFDLALTKSSKMNGPLQTVHGRTDYLRIKIIVGTCLTADEMKQYGPIGSDSPSKDGLKSNPHYFLCEYGDDNVASSYVFKIGQPDIWFITNLAPDERLSPKELSAYQGALINLSTLFHSTRTVIED